MKRLMKEPKQIIIILSLLLLLSLLLSLNMGSIKLTPYQVFQTIFGFGTDNSELVLFDFRLPRIILAMFIGAGLALSGVILQSISQNDLAEPGIIGINAGAGFGVVLFIFLTQGNTYETFNLLEIISTPFAAIIGASFAATFTFVLASRNGLTPIKLVLIGVAVNAVFQSFVIFLQMRMNDMALTSVIVWLSGSIWVSNWEYVFAVLPWLAILIPYVIYNARTLDVIQLGENNAVGLGVDLHKMRKQYIGIASVLAGVCVSVGGAIAFVGLIAPHLARRMVGANHSRLIPAAILIGSILVLLADTLGKNLIENAEIPVGLLIAVLGSPYFIYLLMKTR